MRPRLTTLLLLLAAAPRLMADDAPGKASAIPPRPSPTEPVARSLSLKRSAEFLDAVSVEWTRQRKCGTCHTNYPYLMARPAIKEYASPAMAEVRAFFETRANHWDDPAADAKPRWDAEVVATAAALAINDAATTGTLHPTTRKALDRMWTVQKPDGGWNWLKCDWPPYEHDDYFGAVVAALGAGHAPGDYAGAPRPGRTRPAARLLPGESAARPAPPDDAPLGLHAPRRPDGRKAAGSDDQVAPVAPAPGRRLEPALAGPLEAPGRHGERSRRAERRLRHRPRRFRAPPGRRPGGRPGHRTRRRLARGQPARVGPVVHAVGEQRQGPLHQPTPGRPSP